MIKKVLFLIGCIFLFSFSLNACASSSTNRQTYRTYYESLDLSSPEAAVTTFTTAFQKADFPTVYWVLSPHAQDRFRQSFNLLAYRELLKLNPDPSLSAWDASRPIINGTPLQNISGLEHLNETSYLFHRGSNTPPLCGVIR